MMIGTMQDKLKKVDKELQESLEVRDKLQCQVNLMKYQLAELMTNLQAKVKKEAGIDLDFAKQYGVKEGDAPPAPKQ